MNKIKFIILFVCTCLAVTSCDFLEKDPTKLTPEVYFNNEAEASAFLTGVYGPLISQNLYGGEMYMHQVAGDDLAHYGGGRPAYSNGAISCRNATASSTPFSNIWYTLYVGIDRANTFLEHIDNTPEINDRTRAQYKSEARFLRAYYYFMLVQHWGDVPFKTSSTQSVSNLNIPRTDKAVIYDFITKEMTECADGLKTAAELGFKPGRISRSTAWGIVARVNLFRAGEHFRDHKSPNEQEIKQYLTIANENAKKVMNEGHGLAPNYCDVFIDMSADLYNTTANESIWEIEFAGDNNGEIKSQGRIGNLIGIKCPDASNQLNLIGKDDPGFGYAYYWSTPKLYQLYLDNNDKERMNWNIAPFEYVEKTKGKGVTGRYFEYGKREECKNETWWERSYVYGDNDSSTANKDKTGDYEKKQDASDKSWSRACGKYRREFEYPNGKKHKNYTRINFPMLRYSDVLLMVAETENELNAQPTSLAFQCINAVRDRAGINTYEEGTLNKDAFRQAIKDERGMELCFEFTRRGDLIRWGEYVKNMQEMYTLAQQGAGAHWEPALNYGVYSFFNISETYNYFPIPDAEMSVNKAITENNPGW